MPRVNTIAVLTRPPASILHPTGSFGAVFVVFASLGGRTRLARNPGRDGVTGAGNRRHSG